MKKFSLLIALCMLLTIGGVYATWSYVGSTDIVDAYAESKVTITDAVIEGTLRDLQDRKQPCPFCGPGQR